MSRNGSGTMSVVNTLVSGTTITAAPHNQNYSDIAAEITNSLALDGQSTMTGQLKAANGTAAAPSITFGADSDTGAYRSGTNEYSVSVNGVQATKTSADGFDIKTGQLLIAGVAKFPILTADITDANVTLAKIQNFSSGTFPLRYTASTGVLQAGSFGSGLSLNTTTGVVSVSSDAPAGHLFGMVCSNGSDATNDIDITAGSCRDSTNAVTITLSALTKQLDASFAAGTNAGGRSSASLANGTWHVFAIAKTDGTSDILFHTDPDASAVLPSGYTYFRRIWSIIRSSGSIIAFKQFGDDCFYSSAITDVNNASASATAALVTITVPAGLKVKALLNAAVINSGVGVSTNNAFLWISSPDVSDQTAGTGRPTVGISVTPSSGTISSAGAGGECQTYTNTSSQVRVVSSTPLGTQTYNIITRGYTDTRGRLA